MPGDLAGLRRDRAKASDTMSDLVAAARGRSMTDDEQRDFDAAANEVKSLDDRITAAETKLDDASAKGSTASISRADAAEIARLCADGGVPTMAAVLIAGGVPVEEAKGRIASVAEANNLVALARRKDAGIPADLGAKMLAEGKSIADLRAALLDRFVAAEDKEPVSSHVSVESEGSSSDRIVANYRAATGAKPKKA